MGIRLDNRVAVVTGAGRGLGKAVAIQLAQMGARVVVNDMGGSLAGKGRDRRPAEEVAAFINDTGGHALPSYDSVADFETAGSIIDTALEAWGKIDILVNNAGTSVRSPVWEIDPEAFRSVVDVHLFGTFYCTRRAAPLMKEQGYGRIVNVVSRAGLWGAKHVAGYGAGKGGIFGFTNVAARDLAPYGVTVNAVNPAAMGTRMVTESVQRNRDEERPDPMQERMMLQVQEPEEVAVMIAYLCAEEAGGTNGQFFLVQGEQIGWFQPLAIAKSIFKQGRWTPEEFAEALPRLDIPPLREIY